MRCDAHTALVSRIITIGMMIFGPVGAASAEDCRPIIVKEGYLAQAQFECDFADLSEALTDASRATPQLGARAFLSAFRKTSLNKREISA